MPVAGIVYGNSIQYQYEAFGVGILIGTGCSWISVVQIFPPFHAVPIRDFVPMAEFVAALENPSVKMPPSVAKILDRVIRLREAFADLLVQQQGKIDEASVRSHSFFVDTLKRTRNVLMRLSVHAEIDEAMHKLDLDGQGFSRPSTDSTAAKLRLSTAFTALHVYEPSQAFLDAPDVPLPTPQYEIAKDADTATEGAFVAFAAIQQDAIALREQVNKIWRDDYRRSVGPIQLHAAAVATNTAIDLARTVEEEATAVMDKAGGVESLLIAQYHTACVLEGLDPDYRQKKGDDINLDTYHVARETMFEAYHLLNQFRRSCVDNGGRAVPYDGEHGWYDPMADRSSMSVRQRYDQDRAGLAEVLFEIFILVRDLRSNKVEDELTRGVRFMLDNDSIPFWLVFAAQICLDNLATIGRHYPAVKSQLNDCSTWFEDRAKGALEGISTLPRVSGWPAHKDKLLQQLQQEARFFNTNIISNCKKRALPGIQRPQSVLLSRNAVFAGVWSHHLLDMFHTTGVEYANAQRVIFSMAQFYMAIQESFRVGEWVPHPWIDMDVMIGMQGRDRFWIGDMPMPDQFYNHWFICRGASVASLQPNARPGTTASRNPSSQGPRRGHSLQTVAPVSLMFRGRMGSANDVARINMTVDEVRKIVGDGKWTLLGEPSDPDTLYGMLNEKSNMLLLAGGPGSAAALTASKNDDNDLSSQHERFHTFTAQLVHALAYAIYGEAAMFSFDYFTLDALCWDVLFEVKKKVGPYFKRPEFGELRRKINYSEDPSEIPKLVGLIFGSAAKHDVPNQAPGSENALFHKAALIFMLGTTHPELERPSDPGLYQGFRLREPQRRAEREELLDWLKSMDRSMGSEAAKMRAAENDAPGILFS
ncbi:hypothetical protein B0T19DRAFT_397667 [Cercophora scortea]|uniref:DUF6604 domain-containing protein n=1 Tax=Cercophora scortea TaxID=314031 RepID=A0AAE0IVP8_9PEZI|nr:hypothetical protein B0T19DRAFT_397667 [Cercophora scortea]